MAELTELKPIRRGLRGKSVPFPPSNQRPHKEVTIAGVQPPKETSTSINNDSEGAQPFHNVFKDLDSAVSNLDSRIVDLVKKQSQGFVKAYRLDIMLKQKNLEELKDQYEVSLEKLNKDEKVVALMKEVQIYKDEAQKVGRMLNESRDQMKVLKKQIGFLKDENQTLLGCIKDRMRKESPSKSEAQSVQIPNVKMEPKRTVSINTRASIKSVRKGSADCYGQRGTSRVLTTLDTSPSCESEEEAYAPGSKGEDLERFLANLQDLINKNKTLAIKEVERFYRETVMSYEKKLADARRKILSVKAKGEAKNRKAFAETNELAEFFSSCVKDVQKNINRRKQAMQNTFSRSPTKAVAWPNLIENSSFVFDPEEFTITDKQKVIETLVLHPTVLETIQNIIFPTKAAAMSPTYFVDDFIRAENASFLTEDSISKASPMHNPALNPTSSPEISTFSDIKASPTRPITAGFSSLDAVDLPRVVETEGDSPRNGGNARILNIKFAQLYGLKDTPAFRPKGRTLMKNVRQVYNV